MSAATLKAKESKEREMKKKSRKDEKESKEKKERKKKKCSPIFEEFAMPSLLVHHQQSVRDGYVPC